MKISFFYDLAYPFSKGGAEKRIYDFANYLSRHNYVEIVSLKLWNGKNSYFFDEINHIGISKKVSLYNKKGKRKLIPGFLFGVKTFFFVLKTDSDILDFEIFPYFPIIFARLAVFLKKKKPKIVGNWCECMGKDAWKKYNRNFWLVGALLERMAILSCDSCIAISEFTKKRMDEYLGMNRKRIEVIHPCLLDYDKICKADGLEKKEYTIIYFGRLIRHKHVDKIIDLVAKFKKEGVDIKALIIGNGPEEDNLKNMTKHHGLADNIKFQNFIDEYDKLIQKIKSAKIMIFPSEREGFGISVIEANACGLPVLLLDFPDNAAKELVRQGKNGYLCKNYEELLMKFKYMIDPINEREFKQMSQFSQTYAKDYDKEIIAKKITTFYSSVVC